MSKKFSLAIAILWVLISFFIIQYTYAKYISGISTNANASIATWDLTLNTQDILTNSDFTQNLTLTFPGSTYYNANCVVPGAIRLF